MTAELGSLMETAPLLGPSPAVPIVAIYEGRKKRSRERTAVLKFLMITRDDNEEVMKSQKGGSYLQPTLVQGARQITEDRATAWDPRAATPRFVLDQCLNDLVNSSVTSRKKTLPILTHKEIGAREWVSSDRL